MRTGGIGDFREAQISTNAMIRSACSACSTDLLEDTANHGGYAACPSCDAAVKKMKEWLCPKGRPSKNSHQDLHEWLVEGSIPDDDSGTGITDIEHVLPGRFIDPWTALGRKGSSPGGGVYDGYIGSLLVSLQFQIQNDQLFVEEMRKQEVFITKSLFPKDPETKVLNPFRLKIWENFFEGKLSDKIKEIFPVNLTYKGIFREKSESFCKLIVNSVKDLQKHRRVVKYFGSIWTSNSLRLLIPNFDSYLKKFNELLNTIVGSSLNNCYMITPTSSKKQKVVHNNYGLDTFDLPIGNLDFMPNEVVSRNVFDSPVSPVTRRITHSQRHCADIINGLYRDIFIDRNKSFKDEGFQLLIMNKFRQFQNESDNEADNNGESIDKKLMRYIIAENAEVTRFVKNYMKEKSQDNDGIFVCKDFALKFSQTFLTCD